MNIPAKRLQGNPAIREQAVHDALETFINTDKVKSIDEIRAESNNLYELVSAFIIIKI